MVRGDFAASVFVHLAHEDVVHASSDKWALLAQDYNLGAHSLPSLLDGQTALFIHVNDGDSGVCAPTLHHRRNNSPCDY